MMQETASIKVAMIGLRGIEEGLGGVESVMRELAPRLVQKGIQVTCYCRGRHNAERNWQGVSLVNRPTYLERGSYSLWSLLRALRSDADIIHLHALGSSSLSCIPKLLRSKKRVVVTLHGLDWQRTKWGPLGKGLLRFGQMMGVRFADRRICASLSLQVFFQMCHPERKFVYIPNGTPVSPDQIPSLSPPKGLSRRKYILYMGSLLPEKGVHKLVQAYRQVHTDFPLVIAGGDLSDSRYEQHLRELAKGDSRIRFLGRVVGEERQKLLANAFLFVLPSESEELPVALLEAASYGTCPAVSDIPTMLEVLGSQDLTRGFTFSSGVPTELQTVLETSLMSPELVEQLGAQAQKYVTAHFNWDLIAESHYELYRNLLAES